LFSHCFLLLFSSLIFCQERDEQWEGSEEKKRKEKKKKNKTNRKQNKEKKKTRQARRYSIFPNEEMTVSMLSCLCMNPKKPPEEACETAENLIAGFWLGSVKNPRPSRVLLLAMTW